MLCQFTFRNYRSFRDETEFSMQATKMREFGDSLIPGGDSQSFLPVAVVYGPNAGGKSNFAEALQYVCSAVAVPIARLLYGDDSRPKRARMAKCSPFAFDGTSASEPSWFELYFRTRGYEYRYELEVSGADILREVLDRRKVGGSRTAKLFSREGGEVELGSSLRRAGVATAFNPAIPYLSFLKMNTDLESVCDAADWFVDSAFLNYNSAYMELMLEELISEDDSGPISQLLRSVDIRIEGYRVEPSADGDDRQRVYVRHEVGGSAYELRLGEESAGTQKMIGLAAFLLRAFELGSLVVVDELDAKLHPKLLRFVTQLFRSKEINPRGAQLVFTSQDVSTMRNDVFRRDEIWFAAKDEGEASLMWSLADIHEANGNLVSKNAAFDKQYLAGRYGADPYLERMEEWVMAGE